jgi:UDP:flavonoid glycosyltransferase YjiC (YdhE family)
MASNSADTKRALAAIGTSGDLDPVVAVGRGLTQRGHAVTIATLDRYRDMVEAAGLRHATLRPDTPLSPEQSERSSQGPEL